MPAARRRETNGGCGAVLIALLVVVLVVLLGAWHLGLFDRMAYVAEVERQREVANPPAEIAASQDMNIVPVDGYVYSQLDEVDRGKYAILLDVFRTRQPRAYPETDMDDLARIRDCVIADHPEFFFVSGVHLLTTTNRGSGLVTDVTVEGEFSSTEEEATDIMARVDSVVADCLSGLAFESDDYAKAKYLYEYLATHTAYDHMAAETIQGDLEMASGQTIVDALVEGRAVCAGYARSYQYLLQRLDIPSVYVSGSARGGSHAWCASFLDGAWYFVDPTWGDPQFLDEWGNTGEFDRVDYDYLCVTGADMSITHVLDCDYPVPECASMADNYYVREGAYLVEADPALIGILVDGAIERGESAVRYRCATREVYDGMRSRLFDEQEVYQYLPGDSCRYSMNDDLLTTTVMF